MSVRGLTLCALLVLIALPGVARGAPPPEPEWSFTWWPKLEWRRSDGAHWLRLGGRALFDVAALDYGDDLVGRIGPPGWTVKKEVRQGRIFLQGLSFEHLELKTEVDFAPPDPTLTDAYLGWRGLGPLGSVRFGHQKLPFSFENQMSRLYMVFMERSLANSLDPSVRDVGLRAQNALLDQRLRWDVGGFRSTESTGRFFTDPTNWIVAGRVTGLPYWEDGGRALLHLGVSYSHTFRSASPANSFRIRQRPESNLGDFLVDTGAIDGVDAVNRVEAEIVWLYGPFALQGEWTHDFLDRSAGSGDLDFPGFYVHASWFVTGEHREYSREKGSFGTVVPLRDFAPRRGGWGALQLAVRLSYVDLNDRDVRGGAQTDVTVGANWFPFPFLRLTFNWVHGQVRHQDRVDILQARLQISY